MQNNISKYALEAKESLLIPNGQCPSTDPNNV
jgi:hypothetical protein